MFGIEPNHHVVHQAVTSELSNSRQGTHSSKNRSAVRGGGKKPWKQKGRGVARAGTIRSPLWKGGGVVFGPEPHKYVKKTTVVRSLRVLKLLFPCNLFFATDLEVLVCLKSSGEPVCKNQSILVP